MLWNLDEMDYMKVFHKHVIINIVFLTKNVRYFVISKQIETGKPSIGHFN